jgi:hypothetical protein
MRLHIWEDDNLPPTIIQDDGSITLIDYPHWVAFEVGDQIQYITAIGTTVFFVVEVIPEWDGEREMHIVNIEAA